MTDPTMPNGFTLSQIESCVHRGDKTGFKTKQGGCSCNAKNREPIYTCALRGSCSINRYSKKQTEWVCTTCEDVTPAEALEGETPQ